MIKSIKNWFNPKLKLSDLFKFETYSQEVLNQKLLVSMKDSTLYKSIKIERLLFQECFSTKYINWEELVKVWDEFIWKGFVNSNSTHV